MLVELRVRDLGVVEDVRVPFGAGMTALTGETGAGKTLLVEALAAVLGGRVGATAVRAGADEALVEARFAVEGAAGGGAAVEGAAEGAVGDGAGEQPGRPDAGEERGEEHGELVLARVVPVRGRARGWIDGRMATVATLAERGADLVDVHGQHEQHSLLGPVGQRRALDEFGALDEGPVREARRRLRALEQEIAGLGGTPRERARQLDMLRFQLAEIRDAQVEDPDEDARLRAEEEQLADLAAYQEAARTGLALLGGGHASGGGPDETDGAVERVAAASSALGDRESFSPWRGRLEAATSELHDIAADLRAVVEGWEDDPRRLDEVQGRRRLLADLRRKYGSDLREVIAFAEQAQAQLVALESVEGQLEVLRRRHADEEDTLRAAAESLRAERRAAADRLASSVDERLHALAMPGATLRVSVGEDGAGDEVRFLLAANPGEPAKPLSQVASGGELARTTLALRLMTSGGPDTLLFDEVDAGVGGEAALALAAALQEVAACRQVLVVTHLPQVAAFADHQVVVRKSVRDGRTVTEAASVSGDERVVELSRMLSGHPDSATARAHARELLARGRRAPASTSSAAGRR